MDDVAAYLRMSREERHQLRPSKVTMIEAWLDEQSIEWRDTSDVTKLRPKIKCDFCGRPNIIHPSDGFNLCSECEPDHAQPSSIRCFLCKEFKFIRHQVGIHPVCRDCQWYHHKSNNCKCVTCINPDLPVSWYTGLLDYYAARLEDAECRIKELTSKKN